MLTESFIKLALTISVPIAGAIGYVHGTFATIEKVKSVESRVDVIKNSVLRTDKLICKMAIRQKLKSAEEVCTDN